MPLIDDTVAWYAALAFGAIIVANVSWSRFDQPSYGDKSQYFRIYAPRFSTPSSRYRRARAGYLAVILGVFVFFSLFPKFLSVFVTGELPGGMTKPEQASALPLVVAMLLIGLQEAPGLKQLEVRIRSALHAVGKIPEGVRRTVSQLKGAHFSFDNYQEALQQEVARLANTLGDRRLDVDLIESDVVLRRWFKILCLLERITERNKRDIRISDSFFDAYEEELDSLRTRRDALALRVTEYAAELMKSIPAEADQAVAAMPSPNGVLPGYGELQDELQKLRDRLYTFIACGLRSSLPSKERVSSALQALGFDVRSQPPIKRGIWNLVGFFVIAVLLITVLTVFISTQFNERFVDPYLPPEGMQPQDDDWQKEWLKLLPVPQEHFMLWLWTLFSAAFYLAAVVGALLLRATAIAKLSWFDLDRNARRRPLSRYVGPIIFGGVCGYAALCIVHVINFFALPQAEGTTLLASVLVGMGQSFFWVPLAFIISFFALWVSDTDLRDTAWVRWLSRALLAAMAMAFVGWLISDMIGHYTEKGLAGTSETFETAVVYARLLIADFIAILTTLLMVLVQFQEHQVQEKENLAGQWLTLRSSDGGACDIRLEPDGRVLHAGPGPDDSSVVGTWIHYPEGQVVRWQQPVCLGAHCLQAYGVLLREGDTIIFEEYTAEREREEVFVAQVAPRGNGLPPPEPEPAVVAPLRVVGA